MVFDRKYSKRFPHYEDPDYQFEYIKNTILKKGINHKFTYQNTLLIKTCITGKISHVKYLLDNYDVNVLHRNTKGNSALYYSVLYNTNYISKLLIDYMVKKNHNFKSYPIHPKVMNKLIKYGNFETFKLLSKYYNFDLNYIYHLRYIRYNCSSQLYYLKDGLKKIFDIINSKVNISIDDLEMFISFASNTYFIEKIFEKNFMIYNKIDNFWSIIASYISRITSNDIIKILMNYGMGYNINKSNILGIVLSIHYVSNTTFNYLLTIKKYIDPNYCENNYLSLTPLHYLFANMSANMSTNMSANMSTNAINMGTNIITSRIYNNLLLFIKIFGIHNIDFNSQLRYNHTYNHTYRDGYRGYRDDCGYVNAIENGYISIGDTPLISAIKSNIYDNFIIKILAKHSNIEIKNGQGFNVLDILFKQIKDKHTFLIKNISYCTFTYFGKFNYIILSIFGHKIKNVPFSNNLYFMVEIAGCISKINVSKILILIFNNIDKYFIPCEMTNNILKYI